MDWDSGPPQKGACVLNLTPFAALPGALVQSRNNMRIAHLTPYVHGIGGMEIYLLSLCHALRDSGADVRIAAPGSEASGERESLWHGFPVFHYPLPSPLTTAEVQGIAPARGVEALHRWLAGMRPDVVHFHHFGLGMGATELEAARSAGARTVLTLHLPSLGMTCLRTSMLRWGSEPCDGVIDPLRCAACCFSAKGIPPAAAQPLAHLAAAIGRSGARLPGPVGRMAALPQAVAARRAHMVKAFHHFDRIIALADWARDVLLANGAPAGKVVLNRVGCGLPPAPPPSREPYGQRPVRLGFVGRLHPEKGALHLVRALRSQPHAALTLDLCVSLNGDQERREWAALQSLCAPDRRIRMRANLAREEIAASLAHWDAVVCPSTQFELGPMTVLEAFSRGTPVIATDLPNLNHLVTDHVNGRLFPLGDESALAAILAEIAASPATTLQSWRQSIPAVRTMDEVAASYRQLYEELARDRPSRPQPAATGPIS